MSELLTSQFPTMRDANMPLAERISAAIDRITHGNGLMRVPVEATDPDIVLSDCRRALESQAAQIAALKTAMIAAAEEIASHWQAHCDAEGYGPQNLLRRLEEGIPSEYGYTAGAFAALTAELELRRKSGSASDRLHNLCEGIAKDADGSEWSREEWERLDAEMLELKKQNRALTAERADAERYRWLRTNADEISCWDGGEILERESLDAAIDAARTQAHKEPKDEQG